jgi:carbonic anhydrase
MEENPSSFQNVVLIATVAVAAVLIFVLLSGRIPSDPSGGKEVETPSILEAEKAPEAPGHAEQTPGAAPEAEAAAESEGHMSATAETSSSAHGKPSPAEALEMLKAGNQRFYSGKAVHPHADDSRLALAGMEDQGKYAYATVISCSDSRVPVELIFDAGVMDIFVIRVAGNVCGTNEAGSIEYGLAHVHTPVLVVLGHTQCGAVTAVTRSLHGKGHKLERNIPPLVSNIVPAVKRAQSKHDEIHGDDIIPYAIEENVWQTIEDLFMRSPAVRNLLTEDKVLVVGAIYDVGSGKIEWLDTEEVDKILAYVEASPDKATEVYAGE